jgi:small-conductance mechanosensitive channel
MDILEVFQAEFLGNAVLKWFIAAAILFAVYAGLVSVRGYAGRRLRKVSERTETDLDDFISDLIQKRTKRILFLLFAVYAASQIVILPLKLRTFISGAALLALALQVGLWGNGMINYLISRRASRDGDDALNLEAYSVITWIAKAGLWIFVVLIVLNNMGIKVTALVAGLGISGIAVALAVQNILGDLFASLSIVLDRPFVIGDFIIVGDQMGSVEHVGLKTTRVRSISGEQIVFSNTDLLNSRVKNYRRMEERRVVFSIGVTYQTPESKLAAIPGWIKEIVDGQDQARFDRSHFTDYGDFSLNFETVYFVTDRDFALYRDIQQAINLALYRKFEEEGVEFAYPTQTLFVEKPA